MLLGWKRLAAREGLGQVKGQGQCQETARILERFMPGILGKGPVECLEILNGSAHAVPVACAAGLDPGRYEEALAVLGAERRPETVVSRPELFHRDSRGSSISL